METYFKKILHRKSNNENSYADRDLNDYKNEIVKDMIFFAIKLNDQQINETNLVKVDSKSASELKNQADEKNSKRLSLSIMKRYFSSSTDLKDGNKIKFLSSMRTPKLLKSNNTTKHLSIYELDNGKNNNETLQRNSLGSSKFSSSGVDSNIDESSPKKSSKRKSLRYLFSQTIGRRFSSRSWNKKQTNCMNDPHGVSNNSCDRQKIELINEILMENEEKSKSFSHVENFSFLDYHFNFKKKKLRKNSSLGKSLDQSNLNKINVMKINGKKKGFDIDDISKLSLRDDQYEADNSIKEGVEYKIFADCRTFEEKKDEINDIDLVYYLSTLSSKTRRNAICSKIDKNEYNKQLLSFMEYLLREDYIKNFLL
jgi:hypothetical protein